MNEQDSATSRLGVMSGWLRSMPVATPTLLILPSWPPTARTASAPVPIRPSLNTTTYEAAPDAAEAGVAPATTADIVATTAAVVTTASKRAFISAPKVGMK